MVDWEFNGSRWWKFDFHAHTPVSEDYGKGPQQEQLKQMTPKDWLLCYMQAGIDCVAVTDHNSGAWIDELKNALDDFDKNNPEEYRPIHLFPGVEISVQGGIHVLAIFGKDKSSADIGTLLGAVDYQETKGSCDGVTVLSFTEVVNKIKSVGGLAVPAHVDEDNGLFQITGVTLKQALETKYVHAMEIISTVFNKPQIYVDNKLNWTEIIGSDAHHPSGNTDQIFPGSRFTWVKMGEPSIEGLRLALLDGNLSVRRSDQTTEDPNKHADLIIQSVEVNDARYMGRGDPFVVNFNPWLNSIIGGRGTGKSTLVELMRLSLRRNGELPESIKEDFEKYFQTNDSMKEGLLTEDTHIKIIYKKNNSVYRVQWSARGDEEPIEVKINDETWNKEVGVVTQRFPVRIYSQKQIFELAKEPLALLRIVDDAQEVDKYSWEVKWRAEETKFLSLRAQAREIETGLADEPRLRGELKDVCRKLEIFEQAGHADVLKNYQKRLRQQRIVEEWENSWTDTSARLQVVAEEIIPDELDPSVFDSETADDLDLLENTAATRAGIVKISSEINEIAKKLDQISADWKSKRDRSSWNQIVKKAIEEYKALLERLKSEGAGDPSVYGELVQRRQVLESRLSDMSSRNAQLDSLNRESLVCLKRLLIIRRELTQQRKSFINKVLHDNPYVKIEVIPYGAKETVEAEFRDRIGCSTDVYKKDIGSVKGEGLLGLLYKGEYCQNDFEQRLHDFKLQLHKIAQGKQSEGYIRDARFANYLSKQPPEVFDRLDLWFPEDSLKVEYSPTDGAKEFRSIQEGSPGQKTAALLAFLLSYGEEPLILDQPEDDLDNHLIYDLIVKQLRIVKQRRQVIVVTHNANIVVNGDAELVVALKVHNGQTQIESEGCLQEKHVRNTICEIMEGGHEAFRHRYHRITLEE